MSGVAVRETTVPSAYASEQSDPPVPQLMPVPVILPCSGGVTVSTGEPDVSSAICWNSVLAA